MAITDSDSSSSSSSSESDSNSSSSDDEETVKHVKGTDATSIGKKPSKSQREATKKSLKKNSENSSSKSSATSSDDEGEISSSSSSSSSFSAEYVDEGDKVEEIKTIRVESVDKPSPIVSVQDVIAKDKIISEVSIVENTEIEKISNSDKGIPVSEPSPEKSAQEIEPMVVSVTNLGEVCEVSKETGPGIAIAAVPQIISETVIEVSATVAPNEPQLEKQLLSEESKQDKTAGETEKIVQAVEMVISTPAAINQNDAAKDGEPELKKKKLETVPEKSSKRTDATKELTKNSKIKDVQRRRSSKDRSRSGDRRYKRRSRERDERVRRQRSRSRSVNRRRKRSRTRSKDRARNKSQDRRRGRSPQKKDDTNEQTNLNEKISERQRRTVDLLTSRTGGAYIPPAKLRMMQAEITDKASAAYQRIAWEALKKSIHGYINKVNVDNIGIITRELLKENIVRGRGLLCRSIIQAQAASPTFTHVYAALVAIINSKFPNIGELLLKRLVIQFKRAFRRNDKAICLSASRFVAHLVNQRVAHEILALEILTLLVETPTDDSVEVAIAFLKECGMKLTEVSSKGIGAIFEMLKNILHEGKLDKRVQYMIEVVFQVRKDGFKDHQSVIEALELVEEDDQFTHLLMLDEATTTEDNLNAFKFDDKYETNEDKYKGLSKEILGSDASDSDDGDGSGSGSDDSDSEEDEEEKAKADAIIDNTETNLVALRRTIYLTINSSLDYEECAHKLMKMQLKPGQEIELCHMFLDCCAEQRTYEKFYGLLAQRFCSINKTYIEPFEEIFKDTYQTTHRLDTNRLRNVSKFFAHLLFTDAIGWDVIECIKLNEDDTTSSSRIFIKILFQELAEYMGLGKLNVKLKDAVLTESLSGLFPKDNPRNTRFAINFFTSIGLGGLTDDLRQFLKNAPKNVPAINSELLPEKIEISSTSSSSSSSPSSSSSSDSSSESSSSEDEKQNRKKKKITKKTVVEKPKKKKFKPDPKKKKSKKKQETSSSESVSSESSSSSSSSSSSETSSSSDSSSEDERKKKKRTSKKVQVNKKKQRSNKSDELPIDIEDRRRKVKQSVIERDNRRDKEKETVIDRWARRGNDNGNKRNKTDERVSNEKSENGRERSDKKLSEDKFRRERGDRKDTRIRRSPNRDFRNHDNYNNATKNIRDHRSTGKTRNGSKERG